MKAPTVIFLSPNPLLLLLFSLFSPSIDLLHFISTCIKFFDTKEILLLYHSIIFRDAP